MSHPCLPEDDYPPISALNDLLYCERRCALHRIENVWVDNAHTVSGTFAHQRADKPVDWKCGDGREVHGMWLKSDRLRLVGKADVVEFQPATKTGERGGVSPPVVSAGENIEHTGGLTPPRSPAGMANDVPYPVEYKRGKRRKWDNDDVQLCAQALCLEEMLGVAVPRGAIFHIKTKRRRVVEFTAALRRKTEDAARRLHELIASGITPPAVLKPQCDGCSLREVCLPELGDQMARVERYCRELFQV
jgi:CRISPR-associated exonuclease Cas4